MSLALLLRAASALTDVARIVSSRTRVLCEEIQLLIRGRNPWWRNPKSNRPWPTAISFILLLGSLITRFVPIKAPACSDKTDGCKGDGDLSQLLQSGLPVHLYSSLNPA